MGPGDSGDLLKSAAIYKSILEPLSEKTNSNYINLIKYNFIKYFTEDIHTFSLMRSGELEDTEPLIEQTSEPSGPFSRLCSNSDSEIKVCIRIQTKQSSAILDFL